MKEEDAKRKKISKEKTAAEKIDNENYVFSVHNICNYIRINTKSQSYTE